MVLKMSNKIHGIVRCDDGDYENSRLLVYGGVESVVLDLYDNGEFLGIINYHRWREWILSAKFMSVDGLRGEHICVAFSKPKVSLLSISLDRVVDHGECDKQWLLFSCEIYASDWHDPNFLVASGNAFSDIILWNRNGNTSHTVLKDHRGGVFGLDFFGSKYLASVSDDRTIRIWCLESHKTLSVLFGHEARVWKAKFNPIDDSGSTVFSISEDCSVRLWDWQQQTCLRSWENLHSGKNIWSFCLDAQLDSNLDIFTGGGDGSIMKIKMNDSVQALNTVIELDGVQARSHIPVPNALALLICNVSGQIFLSNPQTGENVIFYENPLLQGHSVFASHCKDNIVVVGDATGNVHLLTFDPETRRILESECILILENRKIKSMGNLSKTRPIYAITVFDDERLFIVDLQLKKVVLVLPNHRYFTCCCLVNNVFLVAGDARGFISVTKIDTSTETSHLVTSFQIPKADRVNSIFWHEESGKVHVSSQCGYLFVYDDMDFVLAESAKITEGSLESHYIVKGSEVSVCIVQKSFFLYWNRKLVISHFPAISVVN